MAAAPPNTLVHPFTPEPRSSLNSSQPQKRPTRLLVFHSGKAMESPTLRIANTVKVLATAQSIPANTAQTMRWAFRSEEAHQAVGVPQREGDGEPHVANREHGQSVGHRPEHSGQHRPNNEVGFLAKIEQQKAGTLEGHGHGPACHEYSRHHA